MAQFPFLLIEVWHGTLLGMGDPMVLRGVGTFCFAVRDLSRRQQSRKHLDLARGDEADIGLEAFYIAWGRCALVRHHALLA